MSYSLQEFQSIKMYHCAYQGPCPRGFHIGSKDEWQSLIDALTTLGVYNISTIPTVLNIPSAYYLARSNGALETRYGIARYWTSTMTSNTVAWTWGINENNTLIFQEDKPGNAFNIRPFKDEPVIPDSSWTESPSGIFKNTTLGLISIQNGNSWITISDKNLGATNVGDDGLYYQFGNNYGFTVNPTPYYTSKVSNTQAYGPSNYYNDDHFVRVSSGNNWFTDTNNNIRGGVDTTSLYPTDAKEVWLGNHRVRPAGWTPGANTLLYLPLNSTDTYTDKSGNNINTTNSGVVFGTYQGVDCGKFDRSHIQVNTMFDQPVEQTILCWCYNTGVDTSGRDGKIYDARNGNNYTILCYNEDSAGVLGYNSIYNGTEVPGGRTYKNQRILVASVFTATTMTKYVMNNTYNNSQSVSISKSLYTPTNINIGNEYNNAANRYFLGGLSNLIVESKAWTSQEISDYYNLTKGDYGL